MIIVVGGIKGGCGKSTTAVNLAVLRQRTGRDVVLVDADDQRSAGAFATQRRGLGLPELPCRFVSGKATLPLIRELAESHDDVIVDVGGRDTAGQRAAMLAADLFLVPFPPSDFDIWTLPSVERLVTEVRSVSPELDAAAFIARGYARGRDLADTADMLRSSSVIRYIEAPVMERRAYARSIGNGIAAVEARTADIKVNLEMQRLYDAVFPDGGNAASAA